MQCCTHKITKRYDQSAQSEESSTRNHARDPCGGGARSWTKRAQLAESFQRICGSSVEELESKRSITCTAGSLRQSHTRQHIDQDRFSVASRGQGKEERTRVQNYIIDAPPPVAAMSSHVQHHDDKRWSASGQRSTNVADELTRRARK